MGHFCRCGYRPITFTRMFEPRHNILSNVRTNVQMYVVSWLEHSCESNRRYPDHSLWELRIFVIFATQCKTPKALQISIKHCKTSQNIARLRRALSRFRGRNKIFTELCTFQSIAIALYTALQSFTENCKSSLSVASIHKVWKISTEQPKFHRTLCKYS